MLVWHRTHTIAENVCPIPHRTSAASHSNSSKHRALKHVSMDHHGHHGPYRGKGFLTTFVHSVPFCGFLLETLIYICHKSSSASSYYIFFRLRLCFLPPIFALNILSSMLLLSFGVSQPPSTTY